MPLWTGNWLDSIAGLCFRADSRIPGFVRLRYLSAGTKPRPTLSDLADFRYADDPGVANPLWVAGKKPISLSPDSGRKKFSIQGSNREVDPRTRMPVGYLAGILLKAKEQNKLEQRVRRLESVVPNPKSHFELEDILTRWNSLTPDQAKHGIQQASMWGLLKIQ